MQDVRNSIFFPQKYVQILQQRIDLHSQKRSTNLLGLTGQAINSFN